MIDYNVVNIEENAFSSVVDQVKFMCKNNNINYQKQQYKVLFSNEKIFYKNNNVKFTSGLKKYLCFYGKIYLNKKEKIIENIHLSNDLVTIIPDSNTLLIVSGGIDNSTIVVNDEEIMNFYVAPRHLLELQDPKLWQFL
jgi:hypothetical protein